MPDRFVLLPVTRTKHIYWDDLGGGLHHRGPCFIIQHTHETWIHDWRHGDWRFFPYRWIPDGEWTRQLSSAILMITFDSRQVLRTCGSREYQLVCDSEADRRDWIDVLKTAQFSSLSHMNSKLQDHHSSIQKEQTDLATKALQVEVLELLNTIRQSYIDLLKSS